MNCAPTRGMLAEPASEARRGLIYHAQARAAAMCQSVSHCGVVDTSSHIVQWGKHPVPDSQFVTPSIGDS